MEFKVKGIESKEEKKQLIAILEKGNVEIRHELYDVELVVVDQNGDVLGGMQVELQKDGAYKDQPCPTYVVKNIGFEKGYWGKNSGLGTALIDKLKEECRQYGIHAISIAGRASKLAFMNGFELLYVPDKWIWCASLNCEYPNCVRKEDFTLRQNSNGISDQRIIYLAGKDPILEKYLKRERLIG